MAEPERLPSSLDLPIVDGLTLDDEHRGVLRPDEIIEDADGRARRLPRFFYRVDSWQQAKETFFTPFFGMWEFLDVDLREAQVQRNFPRYIPCAVATTAGLLSLLRDRTGSLVHISANGGYRTPAHALSTVATPHLWGTAVDIYRIGDTYLDDEESIDRYRILAHDVIPWATSFPYGEEPGGTLDHLHLDFGYVNVVPADAAGEVARSEKE